MVIDWLHGHLMQSIRNCGSVLSTGSGTKEGQKYIITVSKTSIFSEPVAADSDSCDFVQVLPPAL